MAIKLSRGPLFITDADAVQINDVLRRIQDQLDELKGLRGTLTIHGDVVIKGSLKTGDEGN